MDSCFGPPSHHVWLKSIQCLFFLGFFLWNPANKHNQKHPQHQEEVMSKQPSSSSAEAQNLLGCCSTICLIEGGIIPYMCSHPRPIKQTLTHQRSLVKPAAQESSFKVDTQDQQTLHWHTEDFLWWTSIATVTHRWSYCCTFRFGPCVQLVFFGFCYFAVFFFHETVCPQVMTAWLTKTKQKSFIWVPKCQTPLWILKQKDVWVCLV